MTLIDFLSLKLVPVKLAPRSEPRICNVVVFVQCVSDSQLHVEFLQEFVNFLRISAETKTISRKYHIIISASNNRFTQTLSCLQIMSLILPNYLTVE